MATNLHAYFRYRVIDRCLRDLERVYRRADLCQACYDELIEEFDNYKKPSIRTIAKDIEMMRYGKLGYEAPISYSQQDGYRYSDPEFSIYQLQLSRKHMQSLSSAVLMLRDFVQHNGLSSLDHALVILQDIMNLSIHPDEKPIIHLEHSTNTAGQKWIDRIYRSIRKQESLRIEYHAFTDQSPKTIGFSPYFIKEYNNRWFVIGYDFEHQRVINLGLDRIQSVLPSIRPVDETHIPDPVKMYDHIYGVTLLQNRSVETIRFKAAPLQAKYIETKPIHHSQKIVHEDDDGYCHFSLALIINHEILYHLLSFGDTIEVLSPVSLRQQMTTLIGNMADIYK